MTDESQFKALCAEFFPVFKRLAATDEYSITLGGSFGKGLSDRGSDFDFRIYYEKPTGENAQREASDEVNRLVAKWREIGVEVDGIWPRTYAEVDAELDAWLSGNGKPDPMMWTVWGYYILTDICNQQIVEETTGKAARWKQRLAVYPGALKASIISRHSGSLGYWRQDYHYRNKVNRGDVVFLASLAARLINDIMQVVYALNEFYYPGDGMNLIYTKRFMIKPSAFEERVVAVLRLPDAEDAFNLQYANLMALIDDTLALIK